MSSSARVGFVLFLSASACATTPAKEEFKTVENQASDTARRVLRQMLDKRIAAEEAGDTKRMEELDAEIRAKFEKKLAVMVTDMSGFTAKTKTMGIIGFLSEVRRLFHLAEPIVWKHKGSWVKVVADDLFITHEDPQVMFRMAHELRAAIAEYNQKNASHAMGVAIGLGFGPTLVIEHDVFGNSVNTASKLGEDVAKADEILISEDMMSELSPEQAAQCTKYEDFAGRGSKYLFYSCK